MALIARVSRLFKADLHAVLDQLEEPASLLRQSIREMEETLAERERHTQRLQRDRHDLDTRLDETETLAGELDRQLDLCFAAGNETLARRLIRRKLKAHKLAALTRARLQAVGDALADTEAALAHERTELEHLRQKADCFAEPPAAPRHAAHDRALDVGDDEVEVAFLHEKQRRVPS